MARFRFRTLAPALAAAIAFAAAAPAPGTGVPKVDGRLAGQQVKGLRLPLKKYQDIGMVRELMLADFARVSDDGVVHAKGNLQLIALARDGSTNGIARAEAGIYDQKRQYAECHGPVSIDWQDVHLSGVDLTWDSSNTVLRIEHDAVLRLPRGGRSAVDALNR